MKYNQLVLAQIVKNVTVIITISLLLYGCEKDKVSNETNDFTLVTATGDISAKLNEFRQVLGSQLNSTTGVTGGRREINWDGVPANLLETPLSGNFFNTPGTNIPASRQKGLVYTAAADNFKVSNNGFQSTNASTAAAFTAFSGSQTFANVSSNLWKVDFQVAGETIPATVKGFGLVFLDVDTPNSTFIEFFNGSKSVGKFFAPVHDATTNFSFLGVFFNKEKITHLFIGHDGTLAEGGTDISAGGQKDFVAFDDFLFDEPIKQ